MSNDISKPDDADLDIDLGSPRKKGGGGGTLILTILLIAAIIVVVWYFYMREVKLAEQAKRSEDRAAQVNMLGSQILGEISKVQAGDTLAAVTILKKASSALGTVVSMAEDQKDTEDADLYRQRKAVIDKQIATLAPKQEALAKEMTVALQEAGSGLGGKAPAKAPATGAASAKPAAPAAPATPAAAATAAAPAAAPAPAAPAGR